VLIEQDEDGYLVATVPALKSYYTQARTLEELIPRVKEVIELCLQEKEPLILNFAGVQQVEIEA
jgi:predicted RNase H-like HicB family nuclease